MPEIVGPVDATRTPRFAGPATFARVPRLDQVTSLDVAVVGVPFDTGVSYRPGARFGPAHSVDIDVLDPAHAPGTGTPEAGGLTSRELLLMLREFGGLNMVGADVVEVAPAYDHAQLTGVAAAHVAYELISAMAVR